MDAWVRTLLAGGLTAEQYDAIRYDVTEENHRSLLLYAPIACIAFCVLSIASTLTTQGPPSANQRVYLGSCIAMAVIMVCSRLLTQGGKSLGGRLVLPLMYAFMMMLHAFSIHLSIAHFQYPAVSAIVFLLVNPLLFVDRPIRIMGLTCTAAVAVCVTSALVKEAAVVTDDVWNAITFGLVALATDVLIMRMKLTQALQARELAYLSKTDALTQLRNRTNYETRLDDYPKSGAKVLVVAYVDANGLRELNNTQGHDAGDELLKAIASQLRQTFGEKDTFRIGGDEYVVIIPDGVSDDVRRKLSRIQEKLDAKGYSASCGVSEAASDGVDMRALVRAAEKEMYGQKRAYHAAEAKAKAE